MFPRRGPLYRLATFQLCFRTDNHNLMRACQIRVSHLLSRSGSAQSSKTCFFQFVSFCLHQFLRLTAKFRPDFISSFFFLQRSSDIPFRSVFSSVATSCQFSTTVNSSCSVLVFPKSKVDISSDFSFLKMEIRQEITWLAFCLMTKLVLKNTQTECSHQKRSYTFSVYCVRNIFRNLSEIFSNYLNGVTQRKTEFPFLVNEKLLCFIININVKSIP